MQLERAHKRDSVDMEYLKNVVLKYMTRPWTRGEWDREYGYPHSGAGTISDVRYMELGDTEAIEPLLAEMLQISDGGASRARARFLPQ